MSKSVQSDHKTIELNLLIINCPHVFNQILLCLNLS